MAKSTSKHDRKVHRDRVRQFVVEYVIDLNMRRAYTAVFPDAPTADRSLQAKAHRFLNQPHVREAVEAELAQRAARLRIEGDTYLRMLHDLCVFDPADFFDAHGNALPIHLVPVTARRAIASVATVLRNAKAGDGVIDEVLTYRFADRRASVELMLKHLGLLVDRKETGKPGSFARMTEDEKRAKLREYMAQLEEADAGRVM